MKETVYRYTSINGYSGVLIPRRLMSIRDKSGNIDFYTCSPTPKTLEDLKDAVEHFPEFLKILELH